MIKTGPKERTTGDWSRSASVKLSINSSANSWRVADLPDLHPGTELQKQLDRVVLNLHDKRILTEQQKLGLMILDLASGEVLAVYNHAAAFQAASMIKLFIAFAAFDQASAVNQAFPRTDSNFKLLRGMLGESDNDAANAIIGKLGGPEAISSYLTTKFPEFADVQLRELIPDNGATYNNLVSPRSYVELLRLLSQSRFDYSAEFLDLLKISARSRFRSSRTNYVVPSEVGIWHKTGSTSRCCGESAIVASTGLIRGEGSYIISAIIDQCRPAFHFDGWINWVAPVLGSLSAATYEYQRSRFGFKKGSGELSSFSWFNDS